MVHLLFFWLLFDGIGLIVKKLTKKEFRIYWQGAVAILVTVLYLGVGWFIAHHVYETDYHLETEKLLPGGHFITSGIIDHKKEIALSACEAAGLKLIEEKQKGDWHAYFFEKQ